MDWFSILFDAQLVLLVITLVIWALHKPAGRKRRRKPVIVETRPAPQMKAEEIVRVVNSL